MEVDSFEEAIRFYEAAEAIVMTGCPALAITVFLKTALAHMYMQHFTEAVNYAMNAYHLKQQMSDEDKEDGLISCIEQCLAIIMSCQRTSDVGIEQSLVSLE